MAMLARALACGAAMAVALLACSSTGTGGGVSCMSKGLCTNDPPPTASEVSQCEALASNAKCGALFQSYLDCAYQQDKCTAAGVTDDAATQAAIQANCASQASAYRSCSGTVSTGPMCGYTGEACCTTGTPCMSTNCCDPATNKCTGEGESCTAAGSVCSGNQCQACGAPGQPCCSTLNMAQPMPCPSGGCCNYSAAALGGTCIAEGGQCDAPGPMSIETVCRMGSCITCGTTLSDCCAGNKCTDPMTYCMTSNGTCMSCGSPGEPACPP
jgi:hypothetical protein